MVAIVALLFAQLSVAAYACPAAPARHADVEMAADCAGIMNPADWDEAAPNLCAEHCHYGQQSDQPRSPSAPTVSLISLYVVPLTPAQFEPNRPAVVSFSFLAARAPPHTILHCCFRI